jgi:hypothetical protein
MLPKGAGLKPVLIAVGTGLACAAWIWVNSEKPAQVDDVFFLMWARTISPLAGESPVTVSNWERFGEPMLDTTRNYSPGWAIVLSLARRYTGESGLHWLQLPFALMFLAGCVILGRSFGAPPGAVLALCATSPFFLLPTTGFMADIPCLGTGILGLALWIAFPSIGWKIAAGLLLALSGQIKQTILPLFPLLLITPSGGLVRDRRLWLIAAGAFFLAGFYPNVPPHDPETNTLIGHALWILRSYWNPALVMPRCAYGLAAVGATAFFPFAFALAVFFPGHGEAFYPRVRAMAFGAITIPALALLGAWKGCRFATGVVTATPPTANTLWFYLSIAVFVAWALLAGARMGSPALRRLVAWIALATGGYLAGTVFPATRFLIVLLPPLAIVFVLDLRGRLKVGAATAIVALAAVGNLWLSVSLARSDFLFARFGRDAAIRAARLAADRGLPLVTTGSWGLRHYVELSGGLVLPSATEPLQRGAILLEPETTDHRAVPAGLRKRARRTETWSEPAPSGWLPFMPVRTLPPPVATASFYGGHVWLPYGFSRAPLERIRVMEIRPLDRTR